MPEVRRRFSPQFRAEAVQLVLQSQRPVAEVARELGMHEATLGNWVHLHRRAHPDPAPELSVADRAWLASVEEECRRLRLENEFLKKAAAFVCPERKVVAV